MSACIIYLLYSTLNDWVSHNKTQYTRLIDGLNEYIYCTIVFDCLSYHIYHVPDLLNWPSLHITPYNVQVLVSHIYQCYMWTAHSLGFRYVYWFTLKRYHILLQWLAPDAFTHTVNTNQFMYNVITCYLRQFLATLHPYQGNAVIYAIATVVVACCIQTYTLCRTYTEQLWSIAQYLVVSDSILKAIIFYSIILVVPVY